YRLRRVPSRARHASVVEQHHRSVLGESIRDSRIPMVHAPAKVLKEEKGDSRFLPKATVGEPDPLALDEASRSGDVSVAHALQAGSDALWKCASRSLLRSCT